jgi:hypothetical protein
MKRFGQLVSLFGVFLLVFLSAPPAGAQKGGHKPPPPPPAPSAEKPNNTNNKQSNKGNDNEGNLHQLTGLPPKFIENLREMSPEQQERFLANNQRFQNMSPQQQARIRENLKDWNNRTPEQRMLLREREQAWEQMSPQERQFVTQGWRNLPQNRRQVVLRHLNQLNGLNEDERNAKLADPAFNKNLTPQEQQLMPYLSRLRVGPMPEPAPSSY